MPGPLGCRSRSILHITQIYSSILDLSIPKFASSCEIRNISLYQTLILYHGAIAYGLPIIFRPVFAFDNPQPRAERVRKGEGWARVRVGLLRVRKGEGWAYDQGAGDASERGDANPR
jgi:hypothetical protein